MEKTVSEAIAYRRSTRVYKNDNIDTSKVKECLVNASLAPTSSNLQLWEFYHVTNQEKLKQLAEACFNQSAAKSSQQMEYRVLHAVLCRQPLSHLLQVLNR